VWRGQLGRAKYRQCLEEKVKQMRLFAFNYKAELIQKIWHGYYTRKYVLDFYKRKAYLIAIQNTNEITLNGLNEYQEFLDRQRIEKEQVDKYQRIEDEAKNKHYLISTKQIPGIYNSPYHPAPAEMEYLMKNVKLNPCEKHKQYIRDSKLNRFESIQLPVGLPPLPSKPQGPFKDPLDVRRQRYRTFSPSLLVETDIEHLNIARAEMKGKEKTQRLHDEM
jgi:hypothetical protein